MQTRRREAVLDVYNLVLGGFLFVSPWLFSYVNVSARIDLFAVGAAIVLLSLASVFAFFEWEEWITLLLAAWLIASPWALGFTHTRAMHLGIAVGVIVLFLSALEIWIIHYDRPEHEQQSGR